MILNIIRDSFCITENYQIILDNPRKAEPNNDDYYLIVGDNVPDNEHCSGCCKYDAEITFHYFNILTKDSNMDYLIHQLIQKKDKYFAIEFLEKCINIEFVDIEKVVNGEAKLKFNTEIEDYVIA